jgi:iron(III) transport system substrate-binding protein
MVPEQERPDSIHDLTDPQWKGRAAIAKPLFGTTATHAACLFTALGDQRAKEFFERLQANDVQVLSGNKQAAEAVASGAAAFCLTDTDDALQMIAAGYPVEIIYPDQESGGLGTLFIPNTLCIIKDAPHPAAARKLVDYLLSPQVEAALAGGPAGQIPLNPQVQAETRVESPRTVRPMEVDFQSAADQWDGAAQFLEQHFVAG